MKTFLIDTHIAIWTLENNNKLSKIQKDILENLENVIFLSQISLIEIAIKKKLGKLPNVPYSVFELIEKLNEIDIQIIPLKNEHINIYNSIEFFENYRDPFDRLLISTAIFENIPFISSDEKFKNYTNIIELIDNQN
jgi:PIN domain nuclease of toxin-antitoxin system